MKQFHGAIDRSLAKRPLTAEDAFHWAKAHWRPATEGVSAVFLSASALAAVGAGLTGAFAPGLMLPAACGLGFLSIYRARQAFRILRVRARLWGVAPQSFSLADLAAHLRAFTLEQGQAGKLRSLVPGQTFEALYRRARREVRGEAFEREVLFDAKREAEVESLWLGLGFEWRSAEAQLASMLPSRDWEEVRAPKRLLTFLRRRPVLGEKRIGSPVLHGIGPEERPLDVPFAGMGAGLLIVGTTQAGKGVVLSNLISQAVLRGDVVIVIDPKFSMRLYRAVCEAAKAAGRRTPFLLHPSKPKESVRLDPLANFQRPSEIASRLRAVIGSDAKEFADLSWAAANTVVEALLYVGERPTLAAIEKYVSLGLDEVLEKALVKTLDAGWGRSTLGSADEDAYDWRREAEAIFENSGHRLADRLSVLVAFWDDALARPAFRTHVKKRLGPKAIDRVSAILAACEPRAREQTAKVTGSLRTALAKLSGDELGPLLSPDPTDSLDPRLVTSLAKIVRGGDILYVGLDSLTDAAVAEALGMLLLADLASLAGELYNRGESGENERRISLFVDETANVINQPLLELLNKGREAGIRTTCAMQTTADLEAMLGSRAKALQALGNLNNVIALRTIDPETQRFVEALLGRSRREEEGNSSTLAREESLFGNLHQTTGRSTSAAAAPLIDADRLRELPNLEFFAAMGGRLMKGRALFLDPFGKEQQLFDEAGRLPPEGDCVAAAVRRWCRTLFQRLHRRLASTRLLSHVARASVRGFLHGFQEAHQSVEQEAARSQKVATEEIASASKTQVPSLSEYQK